MLTAYTDGSFRNEKGGYGVVIVKEEKEIKRLSGPLPKGMKATNQRAEIIAIIAALHLTKKEKELLICTDSQYCIKCLTKEWKIKTNNDLFDTAFELMKDRKIQFKHIYSHTGDTYNEIVDKLAKEWT